MFIRLSRCASAPLRTLFPSVGSSRLDPATKFGKATRRWQSTRVAGHDYLHLHPTSIKNRYALSFLASPPVSEESPTVIGTVDGTQITPQSFSENPDWRMMMHEILSNAVIADETLQTQAANRVEGYLHIIGKSLSGLHSRPPQADTSSRRRRAQSACVE